MVRTQIQLTEDQYRRLKAWANRLGISLAEAVRRCVADRLAADVGPASRAQRVREVNLVIGKYSDPSGSSRVARDHDDHLADAFGE